MNKSITFSTLQKRIEEEMEADTNLSFEMALQKVYASFGIFGFAHVVQEKTNAVLKRNRQLWWKALNQFFTLPKIIITITVFLLALFVGRFIDSSLRCLLIFTSYFAFTLVCIFQIERKRRAARKKLMLLQITPVGMFIGPVFIYEHLLLFPDWQIENNFLFAVMTVLAFIVQGAMLKVFTQTQGQAEKLFPEAFVTA
jgi:hypothetical protein